MLQVVLRLAAALIVICSLAAPAQEPEATPAGGGARGGGRRGGRGAAGTREFLGLGPAPDEAAAKKGEPLYKQNCGGCHGANARGAQAPNLVRSVVVLHDEKDEEIGPVIKKGRPQAGMPGFPQLSDEDIHNIGQFLKMQVELAANRGTYGSTYASVRGQTTGDPKKGEEFFRGAGGCAGCHNTSGDLAGIGKKFSQIPLIQARLLWPAAPGPQRIKLEVPGGKTLEGVVRTLNDFDVSFVDASGQYYYFPREQVKILTEDKLAAHRALLPKLTDADIHDLAAYLVTLK